MEIHYTGYYRNIGIVILIFVTTVETAEIPKLSIIEENGTLYCMISDDATCTAITWDTRDVNPSYPLHRDYINITTSATFNETLMERQWKYINPMLDYRWENLPLINCSYGIPMEEFSISMKEGNMCYDKETCYTIQNAEYLNSNPEQTRCNVKSENRNQKEWKHFTIIRKSNEGYSIKQHTTKSQTVKKNIIAKNLTIHGVCKVHAVFVYLIKSNDTIEIEVQNKYDYSWSCYGLLVKVPADWNVIFTLIDSNGRIHIEKTNQKIQEWEEIKLCPLAGTEPKWKLSIELKLRSSGNEMLIADVIRHYNSDVRISSITRTSFLHCCYDLVTTTKICSKKLTSYNSVNSSTSPRSDRKEAIVYSVGKDNIKLRFEPESSDKLPCEYKAWWKEHSSGVLMDCDKPDFCKIWPGQICIECHNLTANTSSSFQIKYIDGDQTQYEQYHEIIAIVGEKVPSQPKIISYSWDTITNALTLMWNHPDVPNGCITFFSFNISDKQIEVYNTPEEQLEYRHTFEFEKLNVNWSSNINITVLAHNENGHSETTKTISTPPKTPTLLEDPTLTYISYIPFVVNISPEPYIRGTISNLYFIVTNPGESLPLLPLEDKVCKCGNIQDREKSWVKRKILIEDIKNNAFKINTDFCIYFEENRMKIKCTVLILLENQFNGVGRCKTYFISYTSVDYSMFLVILNFPIIAIVIHKLITYKFVRSNSNEISLVTREAIPTPLEQDQLAIYEVIEETTTNNISDRTELVYDEVEQIPQNMEVIDESMKGSQLDLVCDEIDQRSQYIEVIAELTFEETLIWRKYRSSINTVSRRVKIQELEDYVKVCLKSREFEAQYKFFEDDQIKLRTFGIKQANKSKTGYENLPAYGNSRVISDTMNKDYISEEYINPNYIDGYEVKKAYIIAKGPESNTIIDFWRMIWQRNVKYIIMISSITEERKKKIESYWPNLKESTIYGDFTITVDEVVILPIYESKLFRVTYQGKERLVKHLQFTAWPDQGMPLYPETLATFLKQTTAISLDKAPVVIHCSAGIAKIGTLILCDINLRMAEKQGEIDVFFHLKKLRKPCINMVDDIHQYKLVHLALLHYLVAPDFKIPCTQDMDQFFSDITSPTMLSIQMKYLEDTLWQDEIMRSACKRIEEPIVHYKNRFENILPDRFARVALKPYPLTDESSSYINAIKVDGFCVPSRFIVTQYPLRETVGDIWRLVDEYDVSLIICLNEMDLIEETSCKFYPEHKESIAPVPFLKIESIKIIEEIHYTINILSVTNLHKQNERTIKILHVKGWKYDMLHPDTPASLLMTYEEMSCLEKSNNKVLIACHDATRASGLFTALCFMIDQIKLENLYDVCSAVRNVRHSRAEFVTEMEQFVFLYNCAIEYVQKYEKYCIL